MRIVLLVLLSLQLCYSVSAQQRGDILNYTLLETLDADSFSVFVEQFTGYPGSTLGISYDFEVYKVQYYTLDYQPDSLTVATGLVTIPTNYPCASGIFTFGHGLCLKDREAPSNPTVQYAMIGKGLAANGFIGVVPDYIHLGEDASPGFQAFMNAKTEATATIDLIRAAKTICQDKSVALTDQLFLSGYSQGGHSSFATAREIQLHHANEFTVTAVGPGGGTFDLAGVAADSLASNTRVTPEPQALCLIVRSYAQVYKDSLFNLGLPSDPVAAFDSIFKHPYDSILAIMLDRTTSLYDASLLLPIPVQMLSDTFRNAFQTDSNFYFRKLLAYNSLYDWTPQMPVNFFHSSVDIENPISNVQYVLQLFEDNNAPDVQLTVISNSLGHGDAGLPYVLFVLNYMRDKRVDCLTGIDGGIANKGFDWSIYPNPAQEFVNITLQNSASNVKLNFYNAAGQIVKTEPINGNSLSANVANLVAGNYILELVVGERRYYRVLAKK